MRSAPAAQFTLSPQRESHLPVAILVACAVAVAEHWLAMHLGLEGGWFLAPLAAALSLIGSMLCRRRHAVHLRWDTQHWRLWRGHLSKGGDDAVVGGLAAVIDLGPIMVLRFVESGDGGAAAWRRRRWLIIQRQSLRPQWQAFRRAVYSPRPMVARPDASAEEAAF